MPVDLHSDGLDLTALPRFRLAALQARRLLIQAFWLGGPGLAAMLAAWFWPAVQGSLLAPLCAAVGASLWLLALGLLSARSVAGWRAAALEPPPATADKLPAMRRVIGAFCGRCATQPRAHPAAAQRWRSSIAAGAVRTAAAGNGDPYLEPCPARPRARAVRLRRRRRPAVDGLRPASAGALVRQSRHCGISGSGAPRTVWFGCRC